jgi:hypothetical protein
MESNPSNVVGKSLTSATPRTKQLILDVMAMWEKTLHDLHARYLSPHAAAAPSRSALEQALELASYELASRGLRQVRESLQKDSTLDNASLLRICRFLEQAAMAYLSTLPKQFLESGDAQRLIVSWALNLVVAWQSSEARNPAADAAATCPWPLQPELWTEEKRLLPAVLRRTKSLD